MLPPFEKKPIAHGWQIGEPALSASVPAAQEMQTAAPASGAYVLALHAAQPATPSPRPRWPAGHWRQLMLPVDETQFERESRPEKKVAIKSIEPLIQGVMLE